MSLLQTFDHVAAQTPSYIQNIGGPGLGANDAPCIKGSTLGAVRVGDATNGLILRGDTIANQDQIRGGTAAGGSLQIGSSAFSFQNIALTDGITTVNSTLNAQGPVAMYDDLFIAGNINLTGTSGESISGYYKATVAVAASGSQANPAGLTPGVYFVIYKPNTVTLGQQPSGVFYWSGTVWSGNAVDGNFTGPSPDCAILPASSTSGATLAIAGSGPPVVPGVLTFSKVLNAA